MGFSGSQYGNWALLFGYTSCLTAVVAGVSCGCLPRVGAIRTFLMLIAAACIFRVGMMSIPLETSAYNLTLDPENYPRWSNVWWANTGRYLLYVAGTAGNQVQHLYLLRIVDVAMRVLEPNRQGFLDRYLGKALNVGFGVCMVWVSILLLSQFVHIDYNTALNMSSFSYLLISTILVCLFPIVWTRLFDALAIVTRHRSKAEALREALFPWCTRTGCCGFGPCCRARSDGSGLSIALNDTAQLQNIVSARQKLTVFTQLAAVATAAVFSKCMVLSYMTIGIIAGDFAHPSVSGMPPQCRQSTASRHYENVLPQLLRLVMCCCRPRIN